jgi:7-keto-8-aminopelargonate synthetase-like enzyme
LETTIDQKEDAIISDPLNHASIILVSVWRKAARYRYVDTADLETQLKQGTKMVPDSKL